MNTNAENGKMITFVFIPCFTVYINMQDNALILVSFMTKESYNVFSMEFAASKRLSTPSLVMTQYSLISSLAHIVIFILVYYRLYEGELEL